MPLQPLPTDYQNPMADSNFGPLFEQYKVTYGKALEFVQANLYDTVVFTPASTITLSVFDGTRNITQNRVVCNMPGNTLPDRQGFLVMALQWIPYARVQVFGTTVPPAPAAPGSLQGGTIDDFGLLAYNGIYELRLYEKIYAQVPLIMCPAACGIVPYWIETTPTTGAAGVIQWANNGVADARNLYTLEEPVFIPPLVQIQAQMVWSATQAISAPIAIKMNMGGLMVRPVQ